MVRIFFRRIRGLYPLVVLLAALTLGCIARAQTTPQTQAQTQAQNLAQARSAEADSPADIRQPGGRLVLVLPFDNRSGQANLGWIGDSFPYTLDQRLTSAGFLTISRDDRQYALEHLGLPADFRPSRATTLRIAQTLDADFVVIGSYNVINPGASDSRIEVQAQVLEVNQLRMSAPVQDSSELSRLFDVENAIAWKVAGRMDPHFAVAEQTFLAASGGVRLSSFEDYIRGTSAPTQEERLKRLEAAVAETPGYSAALLALGKEQYAASQFDAAAATLAKVPPTDRVALEANFYRGLARFNIAKYAEAAADIAGATTEVGEALKLHADDPEATELLARLQATHWVTANLKSILSAGGFDPTTRIRRTWSEASFRQAAFQLDQMRALQMVTLPPAQQAAQYTQLGNEYLAQGLLPEAEQEFHTALAADPKNAAAHAGLAQVRERSGSTGDARAEAQSSLELAPNVAAYLVLARIDMQINQLSESAYNVANALRLKPDNPAALGMKTALAARGQNLP